MTDDLVTEWSFSYRSPGFPDGVRYASRDRQSTEAHHHAAILIGWEILQAPTSRLVPRGTIQERTPDYDPPIGLDAAPTPQGAATMSTYKIQGERFESAGAVVNAFTGGQGDDPTSLDELTGMVDDFLTERGEAEPNVLFDETDRAILIDVFREYYGL